MKKGRKYQEAAKLIDPTQSYPLRDAIALAMGTSTTKFDGSFEVHLNLGIDPKQAEQQIRSTVTLPHGTGKKVRVIAFVSEEKAAAAKAAGAVEAGNEDLVAKIEKGWMDFDKAVATPDMMKNIGKIARTLGQAGKMPNPKSGTVSPDVDKMISDIMKGQVEFRNDKQGNLHNNVGKVSFGDDKLFDNVTAYLKAVNEKKPEKMKGTFVKTLYLTTTMGPSVRVDVTEAFSHV